MKERIKKYLIKYDELFLTIMFFILALGNALWVVSKVGDELWNFNNVYKMYNGYKIYIDSNVITTPLFHLIGLLIFKIFGANFFVFRIYNCITLTFIFLGIYKILKILKIRKKKCLLLTLIIFLINKTIIISFTNYNNLAIMFYIYAIIIVLKRKEYKYFIIIESVLITLVILTKQNIGAFYIIGLVLYYLIVNRKNYKELIKIISLTILLLSMFLITLNIYSNLNAFINLCILGINEFAQRNVSIEEKALYKLILISFINILLIVIVNRSKDFKKIENVKIKCQNINILACFAYPALLITYPLFNESHMQTSIFLQYLILVYIIYSIFDNIIKKYDNIIKILIIIIFNILLINSIMRIFLYFNRIDKNIEYSNPYFGCLFEEDTLNKIDEVTDYINNSTEKVIIITPDAALYTIPLKQSNGEFDLLLLGNLGKKGEDGIIEKISYFKDEIILMNKEEINFQESEKIKDYIRNNYNNIGEIQDLLIYKKRK